jgi:hypothetical protein
MKNPHLTQTGRSQFYPLVREALRESGKRWPVVVQSPKNGGYDGAVKVTIGSATGAEFEADLELTDWTRLPARIRNAASALGLPGGLVPVRSITTTAPWRVAPANASRFTP